MGQFCSMKSFRDPGSFHLGALPPGQSKLGCCFIQILAIGCGEQGQSPEPEVYLNLQVTQYLNILYHQIFHCSQLSYMTTWNCKGGRAENVVSGLSFVPRTKGIWRRTAVTACVTISDLSNTRGVITLAIFCSALYCIYLYATSVQEGTKAPSAYVRRFYSDGLLRHTYYFIRGSIIPQYLLKKCMIRCNRQGRYLSSSTE